MNNNNYPPKPTRNSGKSDMTHTYRNNHDFRHDNCFCTCHPKNEKKKGNLKPKLRKNMANHTRND